MPRIWLGLSIKKRIFPVFDHGLDMGEIQEPVLVQVFITQPSVERFDVGILVGLAGLNESHTHAMLVRPGQHRPSTEFLALVGANDLW